MSDLVEFLRARLDEDEVRARGEGPHIVFHDPAGRPLSPPPTPGSYPAGRVLREVEAKRRILDEVADEASGLDMQVDGEFRVGPRDEVSEPYLGDKLLRLLALPYADHEDYDEAWRP